MLTEDMKKQMIPSHLINGRRVLSRSQQRDGKEGESNLNKVDGMTIARRMTYLKTLEEQFRFLGRRSFYWSYKMPTEKENHMEISRVGDMIVIHEDNVSRVHWKLGRVEKLIKGKDGLVRGATLRTVTAKQGKPTVLRRPIQKLYSVEQPVEEKKETEEDKYHSIPPNGLVNNEKDDRPKQIAACLTKQRIRDLINDKKLE